MELASESSPEPSRLRSGGKAGKVTLGARPGFILPESVSYSHSTGISKRNQPLKKKKLIFIVVVADILAKVVKWRLHAGNLLLRQTIYVLLKRNHVANYSE